MNKFFIFVTITVSLISCSNDTNIVSFRKFISQKQPLNISTKTPSIYSSLFIDEFIKGSTLGVYITTDLIDKTVQSICSHRNIKAEAMETEDLSIWWVHSPVIYLNSDPSTVYAYHPYQPLHSLNPKEIPVNISPIAKNTYNYMYGTSTIGQKAVNNKSPFVLLHMKHALGLLLFDLRLSEEAKGTYQLSAIQVGNKAGETAIHNRGYLDITTGKIRSMDNTCGATRLALKIPLPLSTDEGVLHEIRIMPLERPTSGNEIEVLFTINEHTYTYEIPPQTNWERGQKHIYKLSFTGTRILQDKITTEIWDIHSK